MKYRVIPTWSALRAEGGGKAGRTCKKKDDICVKREGVKQGE